MTKKGALKRILLTTWIAVGIIVLLWIYNNFQSFGVDNSLLKSNIEITVEDSKYYYLFKPKENFKNVLIFYPGAVVDPKAYVPLCREISEYGIEVYLIKMPFQMPSIGYNIPKELSLFKDRSKRYILAGHSKGGEMAAQFVFENPYLIDKLILIGTTHPRDISLAESKIPIMKIYGSKDGVADEKSVLENKSKLPSSAEFVRIKGANHSQFGYYGFQLGDEKADISRRKQQAETLKNILKFIRK